jgi:5-methylcytosine-specific restriction endonuclease McrA
MNCIICLIPLCGKQRKFCSDKCQRKEWKVRNRAAYLAGKKAYRNRNIARIRDYNRSDKVLGVRPLTSNTIREVKRLIGERCFRCDSSRKTQIHHIKPRRCGGTNHINNLMILCWNCHMLWHTMLKGYWMPLFKSPIIKSGKRDVVWDNTEKPINTGVLPIPYPLQSDRGSVRVTPSSGG